MRKNIYKQLDKKRILVTGINGFIGSHLAHRLLEEGAVVHGFILKDTSLVRINDIADELILHYGELSNYEDVHSCISNAKPQIIFHLAAARVVTRDFKLIDSMVKTNLSGTINMLRAVIDEKIALERFVNTGTCEEYGNGKTPFNEAQREIPVSPYSASKVGATYFCQMIHKTTGLPIVTIRPFLTYGEGQDFDLFIPSLINSCLVGKDFSMTAGDQTREFNYIDDVVEGFLLAGIKRKAIGEIINIGTGHEYRVRDVAKMIVKMANSRIKLKFNALPKRVGEADHFFCDNKKAKTILGWRPKVSLEEGLKKTIGWFRENMKFYKV